MYARAQEGKFVLRIEDTDLERSKEEYLKEILDSMQWLGFRWDELYKQSDRFDLYKKHAEELIAADKAYREGAAIILKMPQQEVKIYDLIRGEIVFDTSILKDEVLMKSDGSPVYSFACVVDDAAMGITHVIRGEDHIPNTPKQMMIYQAFDWKPPKFAHLPLIMGEDGGRLSKRTGAVAVSDYRREGFLPEALVNYLLLLGWSPGDNQEVIAMNTAIKKFSIKKVNKAAAEFSLDKLRWINQQYIKQTEVSRLTDLLWPLLKEKGWLDDNYDRNHLTDIVKLYQNRMATLNEFLERTDYLFMEDFTVDPQAREEHLSQDHAQAFNRLAHRLAASEHFDLKTVEKIFRAVVTELGIEASDLVHPVRVVLTGKAIGIGLFETMSLLGQTKTVARLQAYTNAGSGHPARKT
jgi:glutamyl-tRNA synthetase